MNDIEKKLSDYIDILNEEKKPLEHDAYVKSPELDELFETVRMVKSLNEPVLPDEDYSRELANNLKKHLSRKKRLKSPRRNWFLGAASIAAALALIFILNFALPFGKTNLVYAMEKAFQGIKAYHGILEITEISAEGKSTTQAKLEVWSDKEGHYYVKTLEGSQRGVVTVNDGEKKWQVQPDQKQVSVFTAFPDPYSFTFELGKEIDEVKNALRTKIIGDDTIAGRSAVIMEVTPQGGDSYKLWIDKETKMPLKKQSAMQYSLQYKASYLSIDFSDAVPKELMAYSVPEGFKEVNMNPEQLVNNVDEAQRIAGFMPKVPQNIKAEFTQDSIAVESNTNVVKINYTSQDGSKKVVVLERKAANEFNPSSMASLGKIGSDIAEVQSPVQNGAGIIDAGGPYAGVTGMSSVRWQHEDFEYAVVGNTSLDVLTEFVKGLVTGTVNLSSADAQTSGRPQVEVPANLEAEKGDQKNADSGHSPWKLDPAFVAQVFVSLKISPQGFQGDYPIKYEELKVVQNNGKEAVVEVIGTKTPIRKVYLKRLIRQDSTGIWTVVGYDPAEKK